mmetsp:Transcript_30527/g.34276  ORF Transcript_30527/g.34276 Transcript_30527/m.34276 type:complete len:121 (-) Transcript_30527:67-429(-)
MATAIRIPENWTVMVSCPIWTTPRHPGRGNSGRIEINVMTRRLHAFDDILFSPNVFSIPPAVEDIALHGDGVHIRFNPVRSTNNNFRMGKMTVTHKRGDHFTFILSTDDYNTVMEIMSPW